MEQNILNQFQIFMKHILNISDEQINDLANLFQKHVYQKGDYFSTPENLSNQVGYVAKGLFRLYKIDRMGNEHTVAFTGENQFMSSYSAILHNQHQIVYVQSIEDAEAYMCDRLEFLGLWESDVIWKFFLQKVTEMDCLRIRKRESDFLMFNAKSRYQNFVKDFPQYRNRIKLQYVASYLGISPETLSRIRK